MAEVALDLEDEAGGAAVRPVGLPGEDLPCEGIHARRGLPGPDGAYDEDAGVEPRLGDGEPGGPLALGRSGGVVELPPMTREGSASSGEVGQGGRNPRRAERPRGSSQTRQTERRRLPARSTAAAGAAWYHARIMAWIAGSFRATRSRKGFSPDAGKGARRARAPVAATARPRRRSGARLPDRPARLPGPDGTCPAIRTTLPGAGSSATCPGRRSTAAAGRSARAPSARRSGRDPPGCPRTAQGQRRLPRGWPA